ncbi:hypothetical protein C9374_010791 [Naegleria lovaniensis]|uniref:Uncharacterized protein n=1 Tax=Naegleria lovaniensis TaxID=51637 RepID=A0AA88GB94_NAELO|nr:uncharacterized protein C9374_010791 [Naegleria lovaniensis]KAG2374507.1 hypothetical protein C9374_010791 [Naegleria lovaniensis]
MPTLVPLWSLCDHGEFQVIPFKEGGCSACAAQGLKRFDAVKSGNFKFVTFGKSKASSSNYRGDVLWWYSEKDHQSTTKKKKKPTSIPQDAEGTIKVLDQNVKLIDEHRLTDIIEVTERHEKPHFYSTSLNEFWSMIYHYGSIEECLKHVEEAEWEGSDDDEERARKDAFADLFSSMMGGYGDSDEDEYYDEDEYDDEDEYYEDDDDDYDEDEYDEYYDEDEDEYDEEEDEEDEEDEEIEDDFGYDISRMHPDDRAHMRKLLNPQTYMKSPESDRPYNHPEWLNFFYQNSVLKNTMDRTSRKSSTAPKQKQSKKDAEQERQKAEKELFDLLEKEEKEKKQKQKQQQQQQQTSKKNKKNQQQAKQKNTSQPSQKQQPKQAQQKSSPQKEQQAQQPKTSPQQPTQQPQQPKQTQQPKSSPQKEQAQQSQQQKSQHTQQQQQPNKNVQTGSSKKKKKKH